MIQSTMQHNTLVQMPVIAAAENICRGDYSPSIQLVFMYIILNLLQELYSFYL